jgi:hypothetical protein
MNMDNIEECLQKIIIERNKAQNEAQYWKAEAKRWREVAIDQDGKIESMISALDCRLGKIESGIRELQ